MDDPDLLTRLGTFYGVFHNEKGDPKSKEEVKALKAEWDKLQKRDQTFLFVKRVMDTHTLQSAIGLFFGRHLTRHANVALQQFKGVPQRLIIAMQQSQPPARAKMEQPSASESAPAPLDAPTSSAQQFEPYSQGMRFTIAVILHTCFYPMP